MKQTNWRRYVAVRTADKQFYKYKKQSYTIAYVPYELKEYTAVASIRTYSCVCDLQSLYFSPIPGEPRAKI